MSHEEKYGIWSGCVRYCGAVRSGFHRRYVGCQMGAACPVPVPAPRMGGSEHWELAMALSLFVNLIECVTIAEQSVTQHFMVQLALHGTHDSRRTGRMMHFDTFTSQYGENIYLRVEQTLW